MKKSIRHKFSIFFIIVAILFSFSYKSDFFEIAKQIEIYTTLFKELNLYYIDEINPAEVTDKAINNVLENLDPYTRFYDEQGVEEAKIRAEGRYGGIGASIKYRNGNLVINEIFKDNPAHKSGLIPGDEIFMIDDAVLKEQSEKSVRAMLKGLPNTALKLKVKRQGQILDFNVNRETIEINPVPFYNMIDDEVGYISFIKFNKKASSEVKNAFEDLKSQGMQKLIIDVRQNPGGLLGEAIKIVNFFIPKNRVVVTTRGKLNKLSKTYKTQRKPLDTEIPIVILIDDRSASASEILAGALQDYDRAVIVGNRSFGKGLVQRSRKLSYGTQLKLTISKYYTPSGRCIQELDYTNRDSKTGIVPRFSDKKVNRFTTQNGREVFDGGGVSPDIEIERQPLTEATKKLFTSDAFFDFATSYYYKNPEIKNLRTFKLNDSDFISLKEYLKRNNDKFLMNNEIDLKETIEKLEENNIDLTQQSQLMFDKIVEEKLILLDKNKSQIIEKLTSNIITRYYFKEGEYQRKLEFDNAIKESTKVLKNQKNYLDILN